MPRWSIARRGAALFAVVALALTVSACAPGTHVDVTMPAGSDATDAALPTDTQAALQSAVERAMAGTGSSGAIVGVWAPWSGTWVAGLGTTPAGATVTSDMTFAAGATTRSMTCDALYGLAADDKLKLDDSVTKWVAGIPQEEAVTLAQLCDSTSGIASYGPQIEPRLIANPARLWNPRELAAYGMGVPAAFAPGAKYQDSDTGYVLLGLALEKAAGEAAAEVLQDYVFDPLDFETTTLPLDALGATLPGTRSSNTPEGAVDCAAPADMSDLSASAGFTAAGALTDINELGRYAQALASGARSYDTDDRFGSPSALYDGAPAWLTADGGAVQAGSLVGQYGAVPGFITAAFADRETGMTVAIVLNNSRAGANPGVDLALELAAIASKAPAASGQTAPAAGLPWTPEQYAASVDAAAICPLP